MKYIKYKINAKIATLSHEWLKDRQKKFMNEINVSLNLKCKIYNVDEGEKSPSDFTLHWVAFQFVQRNFSRLQ